jgi:hypothetical protein
VFQIEVRVVIKIMRKLTTLFLIIFCCSSLGCVAALAKDGAAATNTQHVKGYTKKNGTVVQGYTRTAISKSAKAADTTEVKGYTKKDGTVVKGYTRKKSSKSK